MADMPTTDVNGLDIAYEIVGDGEQTWTLTPGGRFSKDYGGVRELAEGLAATGRRVLIWDRPNCGASSVSFSGSTESALQADTLAALIRKLELGPAVIAGGSGGSRVSLLTVARNPDIASGLAMWWISGGVFGLMALGWFYCGPSIDAAWKYGMDRVVELPEWQEVLERNPGNRERFLAMDPREFVADLERWMAAYAPPVPGQTIPGIADGDIAAISVPAIVFRSGISDPAHPRATSEAVARAVPGATLLEPPWGDREWIERGEEREADNGSLFARWPLLVPQLADFGDGLK
jgi:pimeloyl-ACP methyl ester carboxylesterase